MKNKKTCLVVIDMINGFIFEGALSDPSIDRISDRIESLIKKFIQEESPILNFQDSHSLDCNEFNTFPPHCLENSSESELIDSLKPYEKHMITLLKNSTNGFMHPDFLNTFQNLNCDEFICVGCCTDICVLQFALSLQGYINEHDLKVTVKVIEDCVETFHMEGHDQKECNRVAITLMKSAGIQIIPSYKELSDEY